MRIVVTNNTVVLQENENCIAVQGDSMDVLTKVRDLTHQGYKLLSYPLGASIKMLHSPVTSVMMEEGKGLDETSVEITENSLQMLKKVLGERSLDERNRKDYEVIDCNRLQQIERELNKF